MVMGTGNRSCHALRIPFDSLLDEIVFSVAVGIGMLSYLILGIGLVGVLYARVIYALTALLMLVAISPAYGLLKKIVQQGRHSLRFFQVNRLNVLLFGVLAGMLAIQIFRAFAPITEWDSVYYHLAAPKIYIRQHKIIFIPYIINVNYVIAIEMIHTFFLLFKQETLTQLFSVMNSFLTICTIYGICQRYLSKTTGLLAAGLFYTVPWFMMYIPFPKPDITLTFFATLTVYAFVQWKDTRKKAWGYLASVMSGLTAACKLPAAIVGIILLGWLGWLLGWIILQRARKKIPAQENAVTVRFFLLWSGIFIISLFPWYFKNYVWTGNPFWPYLYAIFGGVSWSKEAAAGIYQEAGADYNYYSLKEFLLMPWNITVSFRTGVMSPLFLAFLPFLATIRRLPRVVKTCLLFSGWYLVIWFFITQQIRFLFPILPFLSIASAYAVLCMFAYKKYRIVIRVTILVWGVFALVYLLSLSTYVLGGVLGLEDREQYLSRRAWLYKEAHYINQHTALDSKIGIFFGAGYYLDREYIYLWPYYQAIVNVVTMESADDLLRRFKELSMTHLIWQNPKSRRYHYIESDPLFAKWKDYFMHLRNSGYLTEIFRGNDGIVYTINFSQGE